MNKQAKRKLGVVAFSVMAGMVVFGGVTVMGSASAQDSAQEGVFESAQIDMMVGASVRYYEDGVTTDESGIRFSAIIDSTVYEALEGLESNENVHVSYGMLIAPYEYFSSHEFNEATVFGVNGDKEYTWDGDTVENASEYTKIAHVTYDELLASKQEGYEKYHEIKGSLVKIKEENLTKEFIGRGYIKYEYDGGVSYKFATYKDNEVTNNVRSVAYVSQLAIDAQDKAAKWLEENYVAKVAGGDTTYTVETYVGDNLVKSEKVAGVKVNEELNNVTAKEYQGFTLTSAETSGKVYANGRLTLKHVYAEEENSEYQVKNGGFESGDLTNWTVTGEIGAVSNASNYWVGDNLNPEGFPFGKDGEYMFSSYAITGSDEKTGYLKSEAFTVSENGWLTFKIGAMKNTPFTYVEIVDSETDEIYKRYGNTLFTDVEADGVKPGCKLYAYKANIVDLKGKSVYIRIRDYARSDYGVVFADAFDALHIVEPDGEEFTLATELGFSKNEYELYNGNFDKGLDGWTKSSNIGDVSEDTTYWNGAKSFDNVGKFFSCYASGQDEASTGILRSNVFTIGGSGWITYRIGGVKNPDQVYLEVIDAMTGEKLGHFYNEKMADCTLISYKADLSAFIGKTVYINFVDNAASDYGLIFCDEFVTYYANVSDVPDYNLATNCVYNVMNGGFETGNLSGWTLVSGEIPGIVTDRDVYWTNNDKVFDKDGTYLFTGVEVEGHPNYEGRIGTFRSNTFILKANSNLKFKMGGGVGNDQIYIRLVKADGEVIACYYNSTPGAHEGQLVQYDYAINNTEDMACYVEIVDNTIGGWGLICLDSVSVYQK